MNRQILDEASSWFVDFRVGDVDVTARQRFDEWLRASPEHIRAYMEIAQVYVDVPTPRQLPSVDELIARARVADTVNVIPLDRPVGSQAPRVEAVAEELGASGTDRQQPRRRAVRALAAGVALVWVGGGLLVGYTLTRDRLYTTEIGERRSITLTDGSTIDLNARSRIRVHFSKAERDVELLDGQALFEVAKDAARPFVVKSDGTWVRAVGTQFQVDRKSSGITVTVVEGRVMVLAAGAEGGSGPRPLPTPRQVEHSRADRADASGESTSLSAGEQVTVFDGVMAQPQRANIAEATAWMQHRLIFDGSRLGDVVGEFNRYNSRQLVVEGGELQDLHISGVYASTDPASLIRFLKEQPGVQVMESDSLVRITRP